MRATVLTDLRPLCACGCGQRLDRYRRRYATDRCGRRARGTVADIPKVPARPLAALLRHIADRTTGMVLLATNNDQRFDDVCARAGVTGRNARRWESGAQPTAHFDIADRVLCQTGRSWWDVYDPHRWPHLYSPVEWVDVVMAAWEAWECCCADGEVDPACDIHGAGELGVAA